SNVEACRRSRAIALHVFAVEACIEVENSSRNDALGKIPFGAPLGRRAERAPQLGIGDQPLHVGDEAFYVAGGVQDGGFPLDHRIGDTVDPGCDRWQSDGCSLDDDAAKPFAIAGQAQDVRSSYQPFRPVREAAEVETRLMSYADCAKRVGQVLLVWSDDHE